MDNKSNIKDVVKKTVDEVESVIENLKEAEHLFDEHPPSLDWTQETHPVNNVKKD